MKSLLQKACFSLVMLALVALPLPRLAAQSAAEPAIVVSLATLEEQMNDLNYFAEAAGMKPMMMMAKAQIDGFTRGIDKTKPAGAMMFFDADSPEPKTVFFLPISKLDDLLDTLAGLNMDLDEDAEPMRMSMNGQEFFMQQSGNYGFISDQSDLLKNLPSNPGTLVGDLPEKFNIGARIYPKRVPQELRDQMLSVIEQGYQQSLEMGEGLSSELQEQNFEMQMAQMRSMINETQELVLGFSIDKAKQNLHFDVQMVGDSGSMLDQASQAYLAAKTSRFSGFLLDNAAFTGSVRFNYTKEDIERTGTALEDLHKQCMSAIDQNEEMGEEDRQLAEKLAEQVFDVLKATVKAGEIDGGACMVMDDSSANLALGFQCVDAPKLESALKEAIGEAEKRAPGAFEVELSAMKKFGATFHKFVVPVPDEEAQQMFGEKATIYVGVGSDVIYLGMGSAPLELLEKAIQGEDSTKAGNGMDMNLYLAPILRKAAQMQNEPNMQAMADKLAETKRDRVRVNMSGIEKGMSFSFEIQDGILELIGLAAQQMGGMMGGPGADF